MKSNWPLHTLLQKLQIISKRDAAVKKKIIPSQTNKLNLRQFLFIFEKHYKTSQSKEQTTYLQGKKVAITLFCLNYGETSMVWS